eukprot:gene10856-22668_t
MCLAAFRVNERHAAYLLRRLAHSHTKNNMNNEGEKAVQGGGVTFISLKMFDPHMKH